MHKNLYVISEYQPYPIYESAEGGYYYEGRELVRSSYPMPLYKARKELLKLYNELKEDNYILSRGGLKIKGQKRSNFADWKLYQKTKLIGEGDYTYIIERHSGEHTKGYVPYE